MSALLLATLGVVCPVCDELNPPKSTTCKSDGTPLDGGARAPAAAPPARPPTSAQVPLAAAPRTPTQPSASRPAPAAPAGPPAAAAPAVPPGMKPTTRPAPVASFPEGQAGPPKLGAAPAAPAKPVGPKVGLMVVSGSAAGQRFRITAASTPIGKSRGTILFADDPFVSATHATLLVKEGKLFIRDEQSASGVYVAVAQDTLKPGAYFSCGRRLFRYGGPAEAPPLEPGRPIVYGAPVPMSQTVYVIEEILVGSRPGRAVTTPGTLLTIGQSLCDLSFPEDQGLATRHCELTPTQAGGLLKDLSGGLGTYVRISGERQLSPGDRVRIGDQVMQVELLT